MVTIRLARGGSKKRPFYHLTVTNSRNARDGRFVERIGFFNPVATGAEVKLSVNQERATYWLSQGAQPTDRVARFLEAAGAKPKAERANLKKGEPGKAAKERAEKRAARDAAANAPAEEAASE